MRLRAVMISLICSLCFMVGAAQAGQVVTSYSGGIVVIDNHTHSLTRAETAILTENTLGSHSVRVLKRDNSLAFSFASKQDAINFTKFAYKQNIKSLSRPGQLKRVQHNGKYYRVYLSQTQYARYKKNILARFKNRHAPITIYQINNSVPSKQHQKVKNTKVIVVKARPSRPITVKKLKRRKSNVYLHKTNHHPMMKLKTNIPLNGKNSKSKVQMTLAI